MKKSLLLTLFLIVTFALSTNIWALPNENSTTTSSSNRNIFEEDFTGVAVGAIPAGWNKSPNTTNWGAVASANAGGQSPEMRFNWSPSGVDVFRLSTPLIDAAAYDNILLTFKHNVNHFGDNYTLRVQTSTDGTTWTDRWTIVNPPASIPAETVDVSLNAVGGESFYLAWVFDGDSYNINYWYVDDIVVIEANPGTIEGVVTLDGGAGDVTDVTVTAGGETVNPATDGSYEISLLSGFYNVTASLPGYEIHTLENVEVTAGQANTGNDFTLGNIEIDVSPASLTADMLPGDPPLTVPLTISSDGNGALDFSISIDWIWDRGNIPESIQTPVTRSLNPEHSDRAPATLSTVQTYDEHSRELFDLLYHFPCHDAGGEYQAVTDGNYIYTARWNEATIFRYELDGTFVEQFTIPGFSGSLRDMTYDGEYFYGSPNTTVIYILDLANEALIGQINTSVATIRSIAYDADNDAFWVGSGWSPAQLQLVDRQGTTIQSLPTTVSSISGLAWENVSDGGPYLWAFTQPASNNILNQIDMTTGSSVQTFDIATLGILAPDSISGGLHITDQLVDGMWTFLGNCQNDVIFVLELGDSFPPWVSVDPNSGTIPGNDDMIIDVTFDPADWDPGIYNANLVINNNSLDSPVIVPVSMYLDATQLYPPQNLEAVAGDGIVELTWEEPNIPPDVRLELEGYNVYRDGDMINAALVTELEYTDTDVENGITYSYYVTAVYDEGESNPSNVVEATPEGSALNPPQNLTYEVIDEINVHLMWEAPEGETLDEFRYDDGVQDGQLGFQGGTNNGVMGSVHRNDAEVHEVHWFTTNEGGPHATVNLFIFGLNAQGLPNGSDVLFQQMSIPNVDMQWNEFVLPDPVSAPNGFMLAMSYTGFLGLGTDDGIGAPWEFQPNTHYFSADYTGNQWSTVESAGFEANFMLRAYGHDFGELRSAPLAAMPVTQSDILLTNTSGRSTGTSLLTTPVTTERTAGRALLGYNVYRDGVIINPTLVTETEYLDENLDTGQYIYYVTAVYDEGESDPTDEVTVDIVNNVGEEPVTPFVTKLHSNYPNPFNPETTIGFSVENQSLVTVEIYNIIGQRVRVLVNEVMEAGEHSAVWNGRDRNNREVSSGIYFYRMQSGEYTDTKKMILMK